MADFGQSNKRDTREVPRWLILGRATNETQGKISLNTTYELLTGLLTEMLAAHMWATWKSRRQCAREGEMPSSSKKLLLGKPKIT
jgi:hypothetical protein